MLTLYTFGSMFNLPDPSPFCIKLELFLNMTGVSYHKKQGSIRHSKTGKLPTVALDGELFSDSTLIIEMLKKRFNLEIDDHLKPEQLAKGTAIQRMLEDHLYWVGVYSRWVDPKYREPVVSRFLSRFPALIRPILRLVVLKRMKKYLHSQGLGRHSPEQIYEFGRQDLRALNTLLSEGTYLLGNRVSSFDSIAGAFIWSITQSALASPFKSELEKYPNFSRYLSQIVKQFMPDWLAKLEKADGESTK